MVNEGKILEEYVSIVRHWSRALADGRSRVANRLYPGMRKLAKLLGSSIGNREQLLELIERLRSHGDDAVYMVVVDSLRVYPDVIEPLFVAMSVNEINYAHTRMNAETTLNEWRKGRLTLD